MGNKKLYISSKLIKIRFDWGIPLENPGYIPEEKKNHKTDDINVDPTTWEQL